MAWTTPRTWVTLETITAALFNTHIRDNLTVLRDGGIAIASQAANDFLFLSSTTQAGRLAAVADRVPRFNGAAWEMFNITGQVAHPVGAVVEFVVATNPNTLLGYGTWAAFGTGRVVVAIDATQTEFDTVEETGGAKTVTLSTAELPVHTHIQDSHTHTQNSHNHTQNAHNHAVTGMGNTNLVGQTDLDVSVADDAGTKTSSSVTATNIAQTATNQAATATNQNTGGGGAHTNLMPYIVCYRWKRTA